MTFMPLHGDTAPIFKMLPGDTKWAIFIMVVAVGAVLLKSVGAIGMSWGELLPLVSSTSVLVHAAISWCYNGRRYWH